MPHHKDLEAYFNLIPCYWCDRPMVADNITVCCGECKGTIDLDDEYQYILQKKGAMPRYGLFERHVWGDDR